MAFVRKKTKVYSWPVEVKTPSETNIGEFDTTSFTGKFLRLSRKEHRLKLLLKIDYPKAVLLLKPLKL